MFACLKTAKITSELNQLRRDKEELETKLVQLEDSYRLERKSTAERHDLEISDKVKQTEDDVTRQLTSKHDAELKRVEEIGSQNLTTVKKRMETEHSSKLAKALEEQKSQQQERHLDEVRRMEEKFEESLEETKKRADDEKISAFEQMKMAHTQELKTKEDQQRRKSEEMERRHTAEMESTMTKHSAELARLETSCQNRMDEQTSNYERQLTTVRQRMECGKAEVENLTKRHGEELAMRNKQMEALKKNMAERRRTERVEDIRKLMTESTTEMEQLERLVIQSTIYTIDQLVSRLINRLIND